MRIHVLAIASFVFYLSGCQRPQVLPRPHTQIRCHAPRICVFLPLSSHAIRASLSTAHGCRVFHEEVAEHRSVIDIEGAGTIEVAGVRISVRQSSIEVYGTTVTSRDASWRNCVVTPARVQLDSFIRDFDLEPLTASGASGVFSSEGAFGGVAQRVTSGQSSLATRSTWCAAAVRQGA